MAVPHERRFLPGFLQKDTDQPGLIQEVDGTVWVIAPDGTRTQLPAGGGGGGAPSGPAGGVLDGTYPDPDFAVDMATQAELDAHAADTTNVHGITDTSALLDVTTTLDEIAAPVASVSLNNQKITGLGTPTLATDAATKAYADALASGLEVKMSVRAATTAAVTLSGEQTIDDVVLTSGDRVLVKNQAAGAANGIYVVAVGAWARSTDADTSAEVRAGMFTFVQAGTTYSDQGWVLATNNPITLGTTALAFTQFSGVGGTPSGAAGGDLAGSTYPDPVIAANAVTTGKILDDAVTAAKIAANAVGSSELADDAVDTAAIQAGAVTAVKVAADVATQAELDAHISDPTAAHAATAISFTPAGTISSTDVQAAIAEVASEAATGTLPGRIIDVTQHGLIDDNSTDNAAALATLLATIPTTGDGRFATFIWPFTSTGKYKFATNVEWGHRAIKNVGIGASISNNPPYMPTIQGGGDNITMFSVTGGTPSQESPSFENMLFSSGGFTGVTGLSLSAVNRCHLTRVGFNALLAGCVMNQSGQDCAFHDWYGVSFYNCATGLLSTSSNSWSWFGGSLVNCGIAIDVVAADQVQIAGIKINSPTTMGIRLGSSGSLGAYENIVQAMIEMGTGAGPRTGVQINGAGNSTSGNGNKVTVGLHGGTDTLNNVGVDITAGANDNIYEIIWSAAYASGKIVQDAGLRNRPAGGAMIGTTANRPGANQKNRGFAYFTTDTKRLNLSDGAQWRYVPLPISLGTPTLLDTHALDTITHTTITLTPSGNVNVGDLVVVAAGYGFSSAPAATCADTKSNTYTNCVEADSNTNGPHAILFYSVLTSALSGSDTITVSFASAVNYVSAAAYSVTGASATPLDQTAGAIGTSTTPSSGNITTTQADEILFGVVSTAASQSLTPGSGWTLLNHVAADIRAIDVQYKIVSATGTYASDGTLTSTNWADVVASFKQSTA